MQKIAETKITTTNGKQYQIVLERYTKGKEPYPFHIAEEESELLACISASSIIFQKERL